MKESVLLFFLLLTALRVGAVEVGPSWQLPTIQVEAAAERAARMPSLGTAVVQKDAEKLAQEAPASLDDLLAGTPNVTTNEGPREDAQMPQIRGLDSRRVLLSIDGVPQTMRTRHSGGIVVTPESLRAVTITKGPQSARVGSGASAGTIELATLTPADLLKGRSWGARLGSSFLSANEQRRLSGAFAHSLMQDRIQWLVLGGHQRGHDLKLASGERLHYSGQESYDLLLKTTWKRDLGLSYDVVERQGDYPLNPTLNTPDEMTDFLGDRHVKRTNAQVNYHLAPTDLSWLDLDLRAYRGQTAIHTIRRSDGRFDRREQEAKGVHLENRWKAERHQVEVGADWVQDQMQGRRGGQALENYPDGQGEILALYADSWWRPWEWTQLQAGLRREQAQITSHGESGRQRREQRWNKNIGQEIYLTPVTLTWGYAEKYSIPSLRDLFMEGLHFPGDGFFIGDNFFVPSPDLQTERMRTHEVGVRYQQESLLSAEDLVTAQIALFENHVDYYMQERIDLLAGTTQIVNIERVRLRGAEVALEQESDQHRVKLEYAQVRAIDRTSRQPLSRMPADRWSGTLAHRWELAAGGRVEIGQTLDLVERQELKDPEDFDTLSLPTGGYSVHHLFADYRRTLVGGELWMVGLKVNNLWNRNYRRHGSAINEAGRDLRVVLRYEF